MACFDPLSVTRVTGMYSNHFYLLSTREKMDVAVLEEGVKYYADISNIWLRVRLLAIDVIKAGYVFCPGGGMVTPEDAIICAVY